MRRYSRLPNRIANALRFKLGDLFYVSREAVPHLRCGICDLEFEPGEHGVYIDDERCHIECAAESEK